MPNLKPIMLKKKLKQMGLGQSSEKTKGTLVNNLAMMSLLPREEAKRKLMHYMYELLVGL